MALEALIALAFRGHPFHDSFHGQQPIAARHRHYHAYLGQLLPGTEADRSSLGYEHYDARLPRLQRPGASR
jgi:hypothetical protein